VKPLDDFLTFYRDTKSRFYNFLLRMTADPDLAAELFQESFTRYWQRYGRRKPNAGLLFTIGRNALIDHRRQHRQGLCYEDRCRDGQPDQETALIGKQAYQRVLAAMEQLDVVEREVLALVVDSCFSYREIARITDLSLANVKVKVHRARKRLRELLKEE
jgi:RNA polymerase sigma-70 factor (ECF subfamily)